MGGAAGAAEGGASGQPSPPPPLAPLQCEHRELFIRHIQGLSLEVQSELAAAIQEVRTCAAWGQPVPSF